MSLDDPRTLTLPKTSVVATGPRRIPLAQRLAHAAATRISRGELTLRDGRSTLRFGSRVPGELSAELVVLDPRFYAKVCLLYTSDAADE